MEGDRIEWVRVERHPHSYLVVLTPAGFKAASRAFPRTVPFTLREVRALAKLSKGDAEKVLDAKRCMGGWIETVIFHAGFQPQLL